MGNNKEIKKFNRKLFILFIIMFAILGTLLTSETSAAPQMKSMMSYLTNRPQQMYFTFNDLSANYDWFCREEGVHLKGGAEHTTLQGSNSDGSFSYDFGELTRNDKGKIVEFHTINSRRNDFNASSYTHETKDFFTFEKTHIGTPEEAYVLSEMVRNSGGYPSYVQTAWWNTPAGSLGNAVGGNDFSSEAKAFEEYMKIITKTASVAEMTYAEQDYSIVENGAIVDSGRISAPVINYEPTWNEDADQNGVVNEADKITAGFNPYTQKYEIGPFSINYVKRLSNIGSREKIYFSSITGVKLVALIGGEETELIFGEDWTFRILANQSSRDGDEEYLYPNPNDVFYIVTDYRLDLNELKLFHFDFEYMNAGSQSDDYVGTYNQCTWTVDYEDYYTEDEDGDEEFDYREIWLELTSIVPGKSQSLAHGLNAARWYNYTQLDREFGDDAWSTITIDKETIGDNDDVVSLNKTYHFKIYVDDVKVKKVIPLTVRVRDGYGSATTNKIYWDTPDTPPTYKVVEVGSTENNGPWEGVLENHQNELIEAENYIHPKTGTLEIDKKLLNPTPALEGETFEFKVSVTGTFGYGGDSVDTYTSSDPFIISGIHISSSNDWSWESDEFEWYGSTAPRYKVEEIIPEDANYELVGGTINNGNGYLKDDKVRVATATNKPTTDWTVIEIDKKLVSTTPAQVGEVFYADLVINGTFKYGNENVNGQKRIRVVLDESNQWVWKSEKISWKEGSTPTYHIEEVDIKEGFKLVNISDSEHSTDKNGLDGSLKSESTLIIITNDQEDYSYGKIKINKLAETSDLYGQSFQFKVTVNGTFYYTENGVSTKYENTSIERVVIVDIPEATDDNKVPVGEWISGEFKWEKNGETPSYTVEEVELPSGSKFVSISNGDKTVTSTQSISGKLIANTVDSVTNGNQNAGQVTITCINSGVAKKQAHIVIIKESEDESIDDYIFFFKVTLTGTFKYAGKQYTNETLTLEGKIDDVEAVCGGEDWVSELIEWDADQEGPKYTVEEISIPENIEFVSISNRNTTSKSPKISGTIVEGMENNYITAINKPGPRFEDGSIRIVKKAQTEDIAHKTFYFKLTVTGEFDYNNKHYTKDEPYVLDDIEVTANGNPWISGKFVWNESDEAPKYTIEEVKIPDGATFVSISNETQISTTETKISGELNYEKPVKITAINKGETLHHGTHIEITKEVLNETLKGTNFYFDVEVRGTFRYYNNDDANDVKLYTPDNPLRLRACAVADEKDWVSGYIEWDEGAEIPQYTISEITSAFPDEVKTVSLRNDTQIIVKELTNQSGENISISGQLIGDMTHIIAVNDIDIQKEHHGSISIEKRAKSEIISGEEFTFILTLNGDFTYQGKNYKTLTINDIKIVADSPAWVSDTITWKEGVSAPTYTVTEDVSVFYDGEMFVSIRNATQTNTEPSITGVIEEDTDVPTWVIAENDYQEKTPNRGRIQLYKTLIDSKGNQIDGVEFTFEVTVGDKTDTVTVTSGSYWRSDWYYWKANESAPQYSIKEVNIPSGYSVSIDKPTGTLVAQNSEDGESGIVTVKAINTVATNESQIQINKKLIVNDKLSQEDISETFTFIVKVSGTFTYNNVVFNDETLTLKVTISKANNWQWLSNVIYWYGDAPQFTVEEPDSYMPPSWHLVSLESSSDTLQNGSISVVDCTNEWDYNETLTLVMALGGKVWDDTNRTLDKEVDSHENGVIDAGEAGIENVKVTVFRALAEKSTGNIVGRLEGVYAYDPNNLVTRIDAVAYTDASGNWSIPAISVPAFVSEEERAKYADNYVVTYDVEFEYDGQTYEPTTFLTTSNGDSNAYINASTSEKDKYLYDSMAIDTVEERQNFNHSFEVITGNEAMDDYGDTLGIAEGSNGTKELHYSSVDSVSLFNADNTRKISKLNTVDENGNIYKDLATTARTSTTNLTFPFYNQNVGSDYNAWHLMGWDKTVTDSFMITYHYKAIYNYCLSINLGLIEREAADIAVEKDLTEATVVVNGKALKYKYNTSIDLDDPNNFELLYKQIAVADSQIEYKLGLYQSDYYYRASIYNTDSTAQGALQGFYNKMFNVSGYDLAGTELEIYLKYTIIVHNQSETYDVTINELADYYDSTFELIDTSETKYVQTLNGKEVEKVIEVAHPSTVTYYNSGLSETGTDDVSWNSGDTLTGSDQVTYNRMTTNALAGKKLASGETANIEVTFKVGKDAYNNNNIANTIKLGKKHNVAEVVSFTSYYAEGTSYKWGTSGDIAGRIDEDSAPNNINIQEYNDKSYYEDDTDSAPMLVIYLYENKSDRVITGIAWEDAQTENAGYGQVVGDGLYNPDKGDKVIPGLTTEIYETINIPYTQNGEVVKDENGNTIYQEFKFAWPTEDTSLEGLGGHSIADLTGFHQSIVTNNYGEYKFIGIPAGNYKVRFVYGNEYIETGKNDLEVVYNGQDYKTTAYQTGFSNDSDGDGLLDNEWHDLSNPTLADLRVSDVRDDEARRLGITAKSEMLTYDNTNILKLSDKKSNRLKELTQKKYTEGGLNSEEQLEYNELFRMYEPIFGRYDKNNPVSGSGYYMYAETAKLNIGIENIYSIKYTTKALEDVDIGLIQGDVTEIVKTNRTDDLTYIVKNIDCGIEERSQTKLTLDKQIKEIKLTTSDGKLILDAIYNIEYDLDVNGNIKPTVTLNEEASTAVDHIASLNRNGASNQGYRYIIADKTMLQGATINVKYQLTVFNMSETDRANKILETLWQEYNEGSNVDALNKAMAELSSPLYTVANGRIYYSSNTGKYEKSEYGSYFGAVYYLGKQGVGARGDETIVKTKVHQVIDYVDPDVEFTDLNNMSKNQSWANTQVQYLLDNKLIDPSIVQIIDKDGNITGDTAANRSLENGERYSIVSDKYQEYITDSKNNIITNINNGENNTDNGTNPSLVRFLEPYMADKNYDAAVATIYLDVSRFYSSESDTSDIDNIAEIIKFENTAGRRDVRTVAGNSNPYELGSNGDPIGVYSVAGKEVDTSATEVITLSPPTGLDAKESRTIQLVAVTLVAVTLIAVGIVLIKKKVLIRK